MRSLLAAKDASRGYALLAYFPAIMFWVLDAYFLSHERRFRELFDHVRGDLENTSDLSMDTQPFHARRNSWPVTAASKTLLVFHGAVLGTVILVIWQFG